MIDVLKAYRAKLKAQGKAREAEIVARCIKLIKPVIRPRMAEVVP